MSETDGSRLVTSYAATKGGLPCGGKYFQGNLIERMRMVWTYGFTGHLIIHNPDGGFLSVQFLEGTIRHVEEVSNEWEPPAAVEDAECRILEALSWKRTAHEWRHHAPPVSEVLELEPGRIIEVVERMESRRQTQEWGYQTCKLLSQGKGFLLPLAFDVRYLNGDTAQMTVKKELVLVGRDASCDVVLDSESVSREHALMRVGREELAIQDKGSLNRVRINGETLQPGVFYPFTNSDELCIGDVRIRVARESRRLAAGRQLKAREDLRLMKRKPRFLDTSQVGLPGAEQKPTDLIPGGSRDGSS